MKPILLGPVLVGVLLASASAGVIISTIVGFPVPLREVAGRLLRAEAPLDAEGTEIVGSFHLVGVSGSDVRSDPGTAALDHRDGRIAGAAVRVNEVHNVDPGTGRPREAGATGPCTSGAEPACLAPGETAAQNLQAFADLCAYSIGFSSLDPSLCGLRIFNGPRNLINNQIPLNPLLEPTLAGLASNLLAGNGVAGAIGDVLALGVSDVLVPLNVDSCDGFQADCATPGAAPNLFYAQQGGGTLNSVLTPAQQALLGCGDFLGTNCEAAGIDLAHTEAAALFGALLVDLSGELRCTRPSEVLLETTVLLPGCRGPGDPGYDPLVDGRAAGLVHPVTGEAFDTEIQALSWNFVAIGVAFSIATDSDGDGEPDIDAHDFDPANPLRSDGCSFARPDLCAVVASLQSLVSLEREDDPSGAAPLRWFWETGAEYAIDEASDSLAPFLGGRLHVGGPERSRVEGEPTGAHFMAVLPDGIEAPDSSFVVRFGPRALGAVYGVASACSDGEDNDGDGAYDYDDLGCPDALAEPEDPTCDDGVDNDRDGAVDFGDSDCLVNVYNERPVGCGLGAELALGLLPLAWWRRRRA